MSVRVRFAPSPTGTFHIGGARTALYNFLFARHEKGTFILRIEDTDQVRSTPESLQTIYDSMHWLSITWDEGPYFQSQRLSRYQEVAAQLISQGRAFRREDPGKGIAVVFKTEHSVIEWNDAIHGKIGRDTSKDPDLVILKSDGYPTYNFACVVDDVDLKITHVIRGDDHVANTPKQISLFRALGQPMPVFAHIPLILNPDGSKMSKDYKKKNPGGKEELIPTSVLVYRERGFLPQAIVNFLALLGWAPGNDVELMTIEELIQSFTLDRVNHHGAQFNLEKLLWMSGHYLRQLSLDEVMAKAKPMLEKKYDLSRFTEPEVREAVRQQHERLKTLDELPALTKFFFQDEVEYDEKAVSKVLKKEGVKETLVAAKEMLSAMSDFSAVAIEKALATLVEQRAVKFQHVAQPIRVAVTGSTVSPPIHDTLALLGKTRTLKRMEKALTLLGG